MPILTGHDARVRFIFTGATVTMHAVRYGVSWRVDALDETTFINGNWGQYQFGVTDFDISVDCLYDTLSDPFPVAGISTSQNVFTAGLQPGNYIGMSLDVTEASVTRAWTFPLVIITDVRIDDSVRDLVRYSVTAKVSQQTADSGGPATDALTVFTAPVA